MQTEHKSSEGEPRIARRHPKFWQVLLYSILLGPVLGVLIAAVVTFLMPKRFESRSMVELRPVPGGPAITDDDVNREIAALSSDQAFATLEAQLGLSEREVIPRETYLAKLRKSVSVQRKNQSHFIEITCLHEGAIDARDIAMALWRIRLEEFYRSASATAKQAPKADAAEQKCIDLGHLIEALESATDLYDRMVIHRSVPCAYHETIDRYRKLRLETSDTDEDESSLVYANETPRLLSELKKLMSEQELAWKKEHADLLAKVKVSPAANVSQRASMVPYLLRGYESKVAQRPSSPSVDHNLMIGLIAGSVFAPAVAFLILGFRKNSFVEDELVSP